MLVFLPVDLLEEFRKRKKKKTKQNPAECNPKIKKDVFKELLSYLACSQIWLNLLVDHCHFGYITNVTKK